jgi:hypothetical protein
MQKRIIINSAHVSDTKLTLEANEAVSGLIPSEQMLVDSDHFSFIYLMEKENEFAFLVLTESIWPLLNDALEKNLSVILTFNNEKIELTNFQEELTYLISNIKGNGNYGEQMVEKVETVFHL